MKVKITQSSDFCEAKSDKYHFLYKRIPKSEDQAFLAHKYGEETLRICIDDLAKLTDSADPTTVMLHAIAYYLENIKECVECRKDKPIDSFRLHKYYYKGNLKISTRNSCRSCTNKSAYKSQLKNKYYRFWKYYKLGQTAVDHILSNGCAVCGSTENLNIDHDHACCPGQKSCGKCVRGVLCDRHNMAAGIVRDDVDHLKKLIKYLEQSEQNKEHIRKLNDGAIKPIIKRSR